jgi:hypothetical protein
MKKSIFWFSLLVVGVMLINSCGNKKSTITPDQVLGYWKTVVGENEYIRLEKADSEYVYSGYTYDRISASGTWDLADGSLIISYDDGTSTQQEVSFRGDTMVFNKGTEKYIRAILSSDGQTAVAEIGDVEILESVIKNINALFTEIEPFKESWVQSGISWQKVTTEVVLKSEGFTEVVEVANQVSRYLVAQGFEVDTTKTSEMINSYKKGNLYVMIRIRASNEPTTGETTFVDVISGLKNK